jgi:hypothetical protein
MAHIDTDITGGNVKLMFVGWAVGIGPHNDAFVTVRGRCSSIIRRQPRLANGAACCNLIYPPRNLGLNWCEQMSDLAVNG